MPKNFTTKKGSFWTVFVPLLVLTAIAGFVCGVLIIDIFVAPHKDTVSREDLTVPSLLNTPWEAGRQKCSEVGLRMQISGRSYNDQIAEDNIISQEPPAGSTSRVGSLINVVVSKGSLMGPIPDVRGLSERGTRLELRKAGFSIRKIRQAFSDDFALNLTCDVFPAPGTVFSRDSMVEIALSLGPKPTSAEVPNLIGETEGDARKQIGKSGLKVGTVEYRSSSTVSPGTVIQQSAAPGAKLALDSRVDLVVAEHK